MAAKPTPEKRAAELQERLAEANRNFNLLDALTIADAEYDAMLRELADLERERPKLRTPDSPTQRVGGAPSTDFAPYRHTMPMVSLGNAFGADELRSFDARVARLAGAPAAYVCELKIDGLAVSLRYQEGARIGQDARRRQRR